jgi:uncharacterized glyoxalase superfamily protein PhnB
MEKRFLSLSPNLLTDDMSATVGFYQEVLGFNLISKVPDEAPYGWAMFERDGITVMVQSRESLGEDMGLFKEDSIGGSLVFFCKVTNLDAWWNDLQGDAAIFMLPRTTFYGMREFGFMDNNGYRFVLAQDV